MGYGNGMAGSKSMIRKPAVRKKMYSREFSTFYTNFAAAPSSARIQFTGSGGVVVGTFNAKRGYPFCFFTANDNSVVNKKFNLRLITADSISRGSHLVTFNQS
tara:strand:- start:4169 stop:4477 length:309 start_codon:yes stop_codon:yes gene_type:complete